MIIRLTNILILILTGSMLNSCILDNAGPVCEEPQAATLRVEVAWATPVSSGAATATGSERSALQGGVALRSFSENSVADLHVAVYNSAGELTGHAYSSGGSVTVTTRSGTGSSVYALVNTGNEDLSMPALKTALQAMTTGTLTTLNDIKVNDDLVMSGSLTTDISAGDNTLGTFTVSRLAARNILNITCGEDITLTGYAIKNLPVKSWYVAHPNTSESEEEDAVAGDDAVNTSVSTDWLNTGTLSGTDILSGTDVTTGSSTYALTFYQYENRRGGRIAVGGTTGDASNQTQKATYAPARATYVELYVNANGTSITYQLYLGANAYTNYNVKRNGSYTYNISIGASGISVSGVSIEAWTEVTGEETTL
jgi:hypothetical protein